MRKGTVENTGTGEIIVCDGKENRVYGKLCGIWGFGTEAVRHVGILRHWKLVTPAIILVPALVYSNAQVMAANHDLKKCRLSYNSKIMECGELYNISLKGVPKSVRAVRWQSSRKKIVSVYSKKKNRAVLMAKKCGTAKITAVYKGRKYTCKVKVTDAYEDGQDRKEDNPVLNAETVEIHYIPDYVVPYLGRNPEYQYSFQFQVSGTDADVKSWSIEGDTATKNRYRIDDSGKVYMFYGNNDFHDEYSECTVKAVLSNGKVLTAKVRGYDDENAYLKKTIEDFEKTYITEDMTEYEKMDKVAWYLSTFYEYRAEKPGWAEYIVTGSGDCMASRFAVMYFCRELGLRAAACPDFDSHGQTVVRADDKVYLVTTGYGNPKPRYYQINGKRTMLGWI